MQGSHSDCPSRAEISKDPQEVKSLENEHGTPKKKCFDMLEGLQFPVVNNIIHSTFLEEMVVLKVNFENLSNVGCLIITPPKF